MRLGVGKRAGNRQLFFIDKENEYREDLETFQDLPTSKRWSKDLDPETFWLLVVSGGR